MTSKLSMLGLVSLVLCLASPAKAARLTKRQVDLFFCKSCGGHAFDAKDHIPSLRLNDMRNDNGATLRGAALTEAESGHALLQYYALSEEPSEAAGGLSGTPSGDELRQQGRLRNLTIIKADGHEAMTAPSHYYQLVEADDAAEGSSSDAGSETPVLVLAAFDSGIDVSVSQQALPRSGSATTIPSGHHDSKRLPRQAIKGYEQRPVHCSRCGSLLGYCFSKESLHLSGHHHLPPSKQSSGDPFASSSSSTSSSTVAQPLAQSVPSSVTYAVLPFVEGEDEVALAQIDGGGCLVLNSGGWWKYKLCHKEHVRQFHQDAVTGNIDPDWSLGSWDAKKNDGKKGKKDGSSSSKSSNGKKTSKKGTGRKERIAKPKDGLYYTSHFYSKGQRCDENGKYRATEVQFYCCPSAMSFGPYIEEITEPSLCRYTMKVCIPKLCVVASPAPPTASASTGASSPAAAAAPPALKEGEPQEQSAAGDTADAAADAPPASAGAETTVSPVSHAESTASAGADANSSPASAAVSPAAVAATSSPASQAEGTEVSPAPALSSSETGDVVETAPVSSANLPDKFILAFWAALVEEGGPELTELTSPASAVLNDLSPDDEDEEDDNEGEPSFTNVIAGDEAEDEGWDPIYDRLPMATGISPVRFG